MAVVLGFYAIAAIIIIGVVLARRSRARRSAPPALLPASTPSPVPASAPELSVDPADLAARLHELANAFGPFGDAAAHPSALYGHAQFIQARDLLIPLNVPLAVVLQYAEGNSWGLSSAALAALRKRADRAEATDRVLAQCGHCSAWAMYFALEFVAEAEPRIALGAPATYARDWWIENRWMSIMFRDYFERCVGQGEEVTFGPALWRNGVSAQDTIRQFLQRVSHPAAAELIGELDDETPSSSSPSDAPRAESTSDTLKAVGRFWEAPRGIDALIKPPGWEKAFALAEAAMRQNPPRSLLLSGEPLVGKTSFLQLLARELAKQNWSVFEASGADLQADQIYIGQLEGRLRKVIDEIARANRLIWYIPDIVHLALSGKHLGQSASMLDQIMPAIAAGRLVVWCEASAKETARLMQLRPSLRGLFETVKLEPLSAGESLTLARDVITALGTHGDARFEPACAKVALDTASQYLGTSGLPGSALLMLKLTAMRIDQASTPITPQRVLETLSQLSGLPVSILDTQSGLDLQSIRDFFNARVIGQDEAVGAMVERIAMLKAGLNDPDKPIGVFLFAGPTGTGKTELAKAVAEFLFGSVERMIRLDMSEFQTFETISKILGQTSAPQIEVDSLISRVRKQPFSVILLDEFEKSHPNIWDLFLQAFDEGRLTDATGQAADLRHCLIILTSNLGATAHKSLGLGFAPQVDTFSKEQVLRAIAQTYRPEFQNRLDKVIVFRPLSRELMRGILKKELAGLLERRGLKDRGWAIEWEASALEFLLEKGFSPEMGARPLKRAIDQYLAAPLAAMIVEKRFPEGEQFLFVRSNGERIDAEFVDPDADLASPATPEMPAESSGAAATPAALAGIILAPQGTPTQHAVLQAAYADIEKTLQSAEWAELKEKLTGDMAADDFWNRADRFGTLARFALMDRVKLAAETAAALRERVARYSRTPRRYPTELSGRLALQLYLVADGIKDALEDAPIELALAIEPVLDSAGDRQATLAWCQRLAAMYRGWVGRRRMHLNELAAAPRQKDAPILLIAGFGAHRTLAAEAGLHVFESSEGSGSRVTARVSIAVVPLGDVPAAKERRTVVAALDAAARPATVVRRYRGEPPLVRDGAGKWRSGRLDLVLGGDFDLLRWGE
jgi:ATP-dependent Clp protease ATP-binding subunit ClpC